MDLYNPGILIDHCLIIVYPECFPDINKNINLTALRFNAEIIVTGIQSLFPARSDISFDPYY